MDSAYGARYRDLFQRHWWWRARERVILNAIRAHRPDAGWRNILDVGCGNGYYTWRMLGAGAQSVLGLDPALLCLAQFLATRRYLGSHANYLLALRSIALDTALDWAAQSPSALTASVEVRPVLPPMQG